MRHFVVPAALLVAAIGGIAHAYQQPAGRACHAAAYTRDGLSVWGGAAECGVRVLNDSALWSWDGTVWRQRPGPPIAPREDSLLVRTGIQLTLIGGRREGVVFDDVWVFDGKTWSERTAAGGPGKIQHGAAAYDEGRRRVVVFGGAVGRDRSGDTYEWDGLKWHSFKVPGPPPRVGHGMAYSTDDRGVLLYGGFADKPFRDLWKWDGAKWHQLSDAGPTFTEGHVVTESDSGIYIVGTGLTEAPAVRVWRWSSGAFSAVGSAGPPMRVGATASYNRIGHFLMYWGGAGSTAKVDVFDGTRWR